MYQVSRISVAMRNDSVLSDPVTTDAAAEAARRFF